VHFVRDAKTKLRVAGNQSLDHLGGGGSVRNMVDRVPYGEVKRAAIPEDGA
jgi:hypothetical protein